MVWLPIAFLIVIIASLLFGARRVFCRGRQAIFLNEFPYIRYAVMAAIIGLTPLIGDLLTEEPDPYPVTWAAAVSLIILIVAACLWLTGFFIGHHSRKRERARLQNR
ncbi:hypothetical protein D6201_09800 [Aurantiacibacter aquimixticola]|uniref:Uncharacterized protein n=1 Tax=Aurantiacibacter aquimixticola TaxID=1958945 RepID=A0A419RV04_9SPHN|nr:hypothetical protein D6201_09800 [Aurantiacibacter aquimixticola]